MPGTTTRGSRSSGRPSTLPNRPRHSPLSCRAHSPPSFFVCMCLRMCLILGLLCLTRRPDAAAPESKVASSVASRVAAASSLASDAAAAFGADKRRPPATPDAARVMVLAEQMEENYPGEMGKIEEKIDEKLAESKALEMAAEEECVRSAPDQGLAAPCLEELRSVRADRAEVNLQRFREEEEERVAAGGGVAATPLEPPELSFEVRAAPPALCPCSPGPLGL